MDPTPANHMVPLRDGQEEEISSASNYLEARGITTKVTLAEDCKPGT